NALAYEFYKGAYIGGIYAAALTDTNRLGYVGGAPLPFAWADFNGFTEGAQSVNPEIQTTATFANGYEDPVGARELASGLYADGVDFIFTGAAAGDLGVVEAAREDDGLVMVSSDLSDLAPANVALVVEIEWAVTIQNEIEHILSGGETGRFRLVGPDTGEISFAIPDAFLDQASGDRGDRARAVVADIEAAVDSLLAGELVIEENTSEG
ncbi:MAG: BMP family ABC transporter substrate-binding protein, partial [bacterium]|nr:BMP family ABC transporter substrate-binding protein [bacterium]